MAQSNYKERIDNMLVAKKLALSRQRAKSLIQSECVFVDNQCITKPSYAVSHDALITIQGSDHPYVGRAGIKLAHALDFFKINPKSFICMDIGASTGGFSDCLVQHHAQKVIAIDVGRDQLADSLRSDSRIISMEKTDIRDLNVQSLTDPIDLFVIDVSFISLAHIFPEIARFITKPCQLIASIKPQFEAGRQFIGKKGIVRDLSVHQRVIESIKKQGEQCHWICKGVSKSPICGSKGNKEYLIAFDIVSDTISTNES